MKISNELWGAFGLSKPAFLVMPTILMQDMPIEWQNKMAALLKEYKSTYDDGIGTGAEVIVSAKQGTCVDCPTLLKYYRLFSTKAIKMTKFIRVQK